MSNTSGKSVPPDYLTAPVTSPPPSVPLSFTPLIFDTSSIKSNIKPVAKVTAAGIGGGALVILVAILGGIAPGTFDSLGVWGPVVASGVTALAAFVSGYIKKA